jgi:23S rRNA pseudouridine1911/1915/1917 synthase
VHCAHLGHPVIADEMYGKGRTNQVADPIRRGALLAVGRQFLHAARLSFDHPSTGERVTFEAPLSRELDVLLAALGPTTSAA